MPQPTVSQTQRTVTKKQRKEEQTHPPSKLPQLPEGDKTQVIKMANTNHERANHSPKN